jgi:outer membrane receptor for ferrienterochelin and colicins
MLRRWTIIAVDIFVSALIVLSPAMVAAAGFGTIEGEAMDKKTGGPLPMVNIIVRGTTLGAATSEDGRYFISRVPAGKYKVIASMMGYTTVTKEVGVSADRTSTVDFELRESAIEMPGVVVTGTRTPRYVRDTPVRTEVITRRRIEDKAAVNFYEAVEGEPGIRVEQQCSYCNFSIIRMQGLESDHVQVMIDGEPTFAGLAGVYGLQQVPSSNIEGIEVVKGAGSALYGSSAIAGVINIISRRPNKEPTMEATMQFGENNTNLYTMNASYGTEKMDMLLNTQKNTGDQIDENNDFLTDRVRTDNVTAGLRINWYDLLGDDQISFSGKTIDEMRRGGDLIDDAWQNPFAGASEHIKTERYEATIGYKKRFALGNEFAIGFTYAKHNRNATNDAFLGDYMATHDDAMPPSGLMKPYIADEHIYVVHANYSHPIAAKYRLLGGFQYSSDRMEETGMYCILEDIPELGLETGDTYRSLSEKHADNYGVYFQGEFPIRENLELVLGARYDAHHSEDNFAGTGKVAGLDIPTVEYDEESINPRAAIKYEPIPDLIIRTSLGTGFRVPYTFEEDLHLCSGSPRVFKPVGLTPEKSASFNLSADYTVVGTGELSVNIFRTNLSDKIGFVDASPEYKSRGYDYEWNNIGDAYTQGIELGLRAYSGRYFSLDLDFTYTDAQYEEKREDWLISEADYKTAWCDEYGGEEGTALFNEWWPEYQKAGERSMYIPRVPRTTGAVTLKFSPGGWNFVLNAVYTGRLYIDYFHDEAVPGEIKHTDPFLIVNSKVSKKLSRRLTGFVGARNLFDYMQEDKRPDDAAFMWAPYTGRIVYGGLKVSFK